MLSIVLAALLTQAPVSLSPLTERHCSSSGWCAVLPVPLYPGMVAARGEALVTNGVRSGVVSLWRAGEWRDTLDTGLGPLRRLVLVDAPGGALGLFACDSARCVRAKVDAERIGPLALVPESEVPPAPPEPAVRSPRPGVRFFLEYRRLLVESGGQKRTPPPLVGTHFAKELDVMFGGGPGEPLWLSRTSETARLTVTAAYPLGKLDRFELGVCTNGVDLLGEPERPTALCDEMYSNSLRRFDGERWQQLTTEFGWASKDLASVEMGEGCAPCFTSRWRILWHTRDGAWRLVDLPDPPEGQSLHRHVGMHIDARGLPGFASQYGTWRHDGRKWRRVGAPSEKAKSLEHQDWSGQEHMAQRGEECNATGCLRQGKAEWRPREGGEWRPLGLPPAEPGWELAEERTDRGRAKSVGSDCRAALEGGEFVFVFNALLVRGTPDKGWRTERLPMAHACHIAEGPEALYLSDPLSKTFMVQRKETAPVPVPEETWATVSGVKAGDVLRVREVPDWRSLEVAALAPGTRCVREVRRRAVARETWAEVLTPEGKRGWVNRRYLAPARGPCSTG
jgi:hypothetical protein